MGGIVNKRRAQRVSLHRKDAMFCDKGNQSQKKKACEIARPDYLRRVFEKKKENSKTLYETLAGLEAKEAAGGSVDHPLDTVWRWHGCAWHKTLGRTDTGVWRALVTGEGVHYPFTASQRGDPCDSSRSGHVANKNTSAWCEMPV